jgi:cobyrinic acid a,c-diamide synthase
MGNISVPRLLIAAPRSGGGKTTVVCALLRALQRRGLRPAAFKCGPDYIDPLFHSEVLGAPSGNLDLYFTPEETVRALLARGAAGCDLAVLEGVMGYYDGLGGMDARASAWHLAQATETPAVLVVDAGGVALSICAEIEGFLRFQPDSRLRAVLLNRCSPALGAMLRPLIEARCGVPVLGCLPEDPGIALQSRHLGLVTAAEVSDLRARIDRAADLLAANADLDRLCALAGSAPPLCADALKQAPETAAAPVIAVARDRAFCFYYRENLALLEELGARLAFFSPLADRALPEGTAALYLGGGYPELYAAALADNAPMRAAVRAAVTGGMPAFCECGGFLYLHASLTDPEGRTFPMAGVLPGGCRWTGALRRFGYVELTAARDNLFCAAGGRIRAHEFHYYESDDCGDGFTAQRAAGPQSWPCVHADGSLYAGFPHLYFYANPAFARAFVGAAARYGAGR